MSPRPMAEKLPLQVTELRCLMQQCDEDWDELTQSIQADTLRLADAQQHLENFRLLLASQCEQPLCQMMALTMRAAALECQVALLQQGIALKGARRNSLARQFDQARLALVALRKTAPVKRPVFPARAWKLLIACVQRPLRGCWSALRRPVEHGEVIPGGTPLWPCL